MNIRSALIVTMLLTLAFVPATASASFVQALCGDTGEATKPAPKKVAEAADEACRLVATPADAQVGTLGEGVGAHTGIYIVPAGKCVGLWAESNGASGHQGSGENPDTELAKACR